jgi:predicted alpha/beta hydrolase
MNKTYISIICEDGFPLAATLYQPKTVKAAVMIAPATGIKQTFYNSFASFLADSGFGVICYDNRGIGKSRKGSINDGDPSLITWGREDMSAVLEKLKDLFPETTYHLVGHSAGGQLVGLMKNTNDLGSMFNFACSSGSIRNMGFAFKFQAYFFMNVFIPINNLLFGQTNSQWVGMGEPLPKTVATQWSQWCNGSGYVAMAFEKEIDKHAYDEIDIPSLWLHATDDSIANLANVKDMIRVFPNLKSEIVTLEPRILGFKEIGHMKFFSSKNKKLWNYAVSFLNENLK